MSGAALGGWKEDARHAEVVADYVAQLEELDRERYTAQSDNETLREGLEWIIAFAEKNVAGGPLVGRHTGFVHITRRARAALEGASDE